ncbi:MAG: hypothetical protein CME70_12225 [Halobacteriovorax sp.]|nr:hypothetical protein [Halobacteriovorax sp.]|tara:strand:+ start:276919 stop:278196 length:1278 start_codon:yes stop_codon:yes gene_type:complete
MKSIKKLKTGFFSRQLSMAKIALKTGSSYLMSGDEDLKTKLRSGLEKHLDLVVEELGVMKGSLMKAGQMLSLYAGAFLPPEAQKILKSLENQSSFLDWSVLEKRVPKKWLEELEIEEIPLAAASLGQVHMARKKGAKESFVMKIQYEGVKKAIDNDVKALKMLLNMMDLLPKEIEFKEIFEEIKEMLYLETDYKAEAASTNKFLELIKDYPEYTAPKIIEEYSNDSILSSTFLDGYSPRDSKVKALPQEVRNKLGESFLRLFFLELYTWGVMQTDPHFGNYLIVDIDSDPKWGLIDFGATKTIPEEFRKNYQELIKTCALLDKESYFKTVEKMGYLSKEKQSNTDLLWEYANLIGEPFNNGVYDWGRSSTPDEVFKFAPRLLKEIAIGKPPKDGVFIDRKVGGVFFVLKEIGAKFDAMKVLKEFI